MWLKEFLIVHLIVLQNTIFAQPLIENEKNRESRQTRYEECCPCPGISEGANFRDQDLMPSQKSSVFRMPLDECPCRSGSDTEGSPSIFYPSFLRGAQPRDRSQEIKQDPKPLLRPEVGLASSVLETLKEATDEEYKDALLRDATRTALKAAEPVLLDTEPGATKNSITIVINPRDLDNGNDAISEASHAHETRCIHSPLRSSNFQSSRRTVLPRLSKEYLLLPKRKFKELQHKSLFDMDNSPSNIQANFDVLDTKDFGNKLKMTPSLFSGLSSRMGELKDSWSNSGTKLRMSPEQCDDLNRQTKMDSSHMLTLATLKTKLRDLSEARNAKRLNNNLHDGLQHNKFKVFDTKHDDEVLKFSVPKLPTFDNVIDKQSPLVKNILKLRDVDLLPPRKTNIKDVSKIKYEQSDLKAAGTENKADFVISSNIVTEKNSNECDVTNRHFSDEFASDELKETEPKSVTSDISISSVQQAESQEGHEAAPINDSSSHIIKPMCDETDMLSSSAEKYFKNNVETGFQNKIFNINDQQNDTADEIKDFDPESTNILQQVNQEDKSTENDYLSAEDNESDEDDCFGEKFSTVSPIILPINMDEKVKGRSLSVARESSQRSSLKDDILKKLENLRNTVKTKLVETEFDNFQDTQLTHTSSTSTPSYHTMNENPVTTRELQRLSDSLLNQEKSSSTKSETLSKTECVINDITSDNILNNNEGYETYNYKVNDNNSSSLELHEVDTQLYVSGEPSENFLKYNLNDRLNTTLNPSIQNDFGNFQTPEHTCGTVSNESYDIADENISTKNEMSSQASNLKYNTLRPQLSDNNLRSSMPQDIAVEPSNIKKKDFKKSFEIPSLEEIKQSITNIIHAGQREEEELRAIDSDPLNESSSINLMQLSNANMRSKLLNSDLSPLSSIQRNSLMQRLNLNSYKSRPELPDIVASLKPLKLPSMQNNRAGIFGNYLSSGNDKVKSLSNSKSALGVLETSSKGSQTLDKIRDSLNTHRKTVFREVPFRLEHLPISNTGQSLNSIKNGLKSYTGNSMKTLQSNLRDITVGNQETLRKSKADSNNILETIERRREDMKEKLQALHIDFNDRLATIHDRLVDQTNLQSINTPVYKDSSNVMNSPVIGCEQENNPHNLVSGRQAHKENNLLLKSKFSPKQDHNFNSQKILTPKDSKSFYISRRNDDDEFIMKQNAEILNDNQLLNEKKLSDSHKLNKIEAQKNNLEKQRGLLPPSNGHIKISFTSSTITPVTKQKTPTPIYAKKFPLDVLKQNDNHGKKNTVHSRLKAISNAYRTKINNLEDSKHSPSELISFRTQPSEKLLSEKKIMKNFFTEPEGNSPLLSTTISNNKSRLSSGNAVPKNVLDAKITHLDKSVAPTTKENQFVTNIRQALRTRLANITPVSKTSTKDKHDQKPFLDVVESPSENLKTVEVINNPLKESTSYKCTIMCVRE